jgi:hypothetical protein
MMMIVTRFMDHHWKNMKGMTSSSISTICLDSRIWKQNQNLILLEWERLKLNHQIEMKIEHKKNNQARDRLKYLKMKKPLLLTKAQR